MGVHLGLVFNKRFSYPDFDADDGKTVSFFLRMLDTIAEDNGLTPLVNFTNDEENEELDPDELDEEPWFDCKDALRTVSGLITALESRKKQPIERWPKGSRKALMASLKKLQRGLRLAVQRGCSCYFIFY